MRHGFSINFLLMVTATPCPQAAVLNTKGINPEKRRRPSILALSRQNLPNLPGTSIDGVAKGAYVVQGGDEKPDVIVLATGAHP